jgi:hypothetical protein
VPTPRKNGPQIAGSFRIGVHEIVGVANFGPLKLVTGTRRRVSGELTVKSDKHASKDAAKPADIRRNEPAREVGGILRKLASGCPDLSGAQLDRLCDELKPDAAVPMPDLVELAQALRGGRDRVRAALLEWQTSERLAACLDGTDAARRIVDETMNGPFPPQTSISKEFLDFLVRRQQNTELCCRILAYALCEVLYPSSRSSAFVSVGTAEDRH